MKLKVDFMEIGFLSKFYQKKFFPIEFPLLTLLYQNPFYQNWFVLLVYIVYI